MKKKKKYYQNKSHLNRIQILKKNQKLVRKQISLPINTLKKIILNNLFSIDSTATKHTYATANNTDPFFSN